MTFYTGLGYDRRRQRCAGGREGLDSFHNQSILLQLLRQRKRKNGTFFRFDTVALGAAYKEPQSEDYAVFLGSLGRSSYSDSVLPEIGNTNFLRF